jgi:hypothetical protein
MPMKFREKQKLARELNKTLERLKTSYNKKREIDNKYLIRAIGILATFVFNHEYQFESLFKALTDI